MKRDNAYQCSLLAACCTCRVLCAKRDKLLVFFLILSMTLTLGGCDLLFNQNGDDIKKEIQDSVWDATAPQLSVRIETSMNLGSVYPAGAYTAKQKIPFTVLYNPDPGQKGFFAGWEAYSAGDASNPLGADYVRFGTPGEPETSVTVLKEAGSYIIRPRIEIRPAIRSRRPEGTAQAVQINYPIQILFTKPVDPASFVYENGRYRNNQGLFKNITLTGVRGLGLEENFAPYFEDPFLDDSHTTLTIRVKEEGLPLNSTVTVTLAGEIRSLAGIWGEEIEIPMAGAESWSYRVGSEEDEVPPMISPVLGTIGAGARMFADSDGYVIDRRFGGPQADNSLYNPSVYLAFYAYDEITDEISSVKIIEKRTHDITGLGVSDPPGAGTIMYREDFIDPATEPGIGIREEFIRATNNTYPRCYIVKYELGSRSPGSDGIIELTLLPSDLLGNELDENDLTLGAGRISVVYDTTVPSPLSPAVFDQMTTGGRPLTGVDVFGPDQPNITLASTASSYSIADEGHSSSGIPKTACAPADMEWQFIISRSEAEHIIGENVNGGWYKVGSFPAQAEAMGFLGSGSALFDLKLNVRDNLGNKIAAPVAAARDLFIDWEKPEFSGDVSVRTDAGELPEIIPMGPSYTGFNGSSKPVVHAIKGPASRQVEVSFAISNEVYGGSYLIKTTKSRPSASDPSWDYSPNPNITVNDVTIPGPNGIKVVYVWIKDAAGNMVDTPQEYSILMEDDPPGAAHSSLSDNIRVLGMWYEDDTILDPDGYLYQGDGNYFHDLTDEGDYFFIMRPFYALYVKATDRALRPLTNSGAVAMELFSYSQGSFQPYSYRTGSIESDINTNLGWHLRRDGNMELNIEYDEDSPYEAHNIRIIDAVGNFSFYPAQVNPIPDDNNPREEYLRNGGENYPIKVCLDDVPPEFDGAECKITAGAFYIDDTWANFRGKLIYVRQADLSPEITMRLKDEGHDVSERKSGLAGIQMSWYDYSYIPINQSSLPKDADVYKTVSARFGREELAIMPILDSEDLPQKTITDDMVSYYLIQGFDNIGNSIVLETLILDDGIVPIPLDGVSNDLFCEDLNDGSGTIFLNYALVLDNTAPAFDRDLASYGESGGDIELSGVREAGSGIKTIEITAGESISGSASVTQSGVVGALDCSTSLAGKTVTITFGSPVRAAEAEYNTLTITGLSYSGGIDAITLTDAVGLEF